LDKAAVAEVTVRMTWASAAAGLAAAAAGLEAAAAEEVVRALLFFRIGRS
jgi:hypothetical protein